MVFSKRITIFAVQKTNRQDYLSDLCLVSIFCMSLTDLCQILAQPISLCIDNSKSQNLFFQRV